MPAADQRGHAGRDQWPCTVRYIVDLDALNEAIDDDDPDGAVIVQFLWRYCHPHKDVTGTRVSLFQRVGELVDLLDADTVLLDGSNKSTCLELELGKGSLDHDAPGGEA